MYSIQVGGETFLAFCVDARRPGPSTQGSFSMRIITDETLSTTINNVIELAPVHLGLGANEYLVDFILHFGQVNAGFMSIENPRIFVNVFPRTAATLWSNERLPQSGW